MTGNSAASGSAPILRVEGHFQALRQAAWLGERLANRLGASHRETVVQALDDVSLDVAAVRCWALLANRDAARARWADHRGLMPPSSGRVIFSASDVVGAAESAVGAGARVGRDSPGK